jgi:hypothetical protein
MKIIGKTDKGFILEAHEDEIAKLIGYHYESSMPARKNQSYGSHDKLKIGDEINVAKMFQHLAAIESAGKDVAAVVAKLRTAADLLETLPDPVTEVKVQPDPLPSSQ